MPVEPQVHELIARLRRLEQHNRELEVQLEILRARERHFRAQKDRELQKKNDHLAEINTALQTLVKIRDQDKAEIEETIVATIHQLVDPLLVRLKASGLSERQKSYVAILEANLHEVITPFSRQIATHYLELTPAEVEVANLVKHGRKTKEIASLLNISTRTVEMHRRNIRRKLGLRNKHANLRTFLLAKTTG